MASSAQTRSFPEKSQILRRPLVLPAPVAGHTEPHRDSRPHLPPHVSIKRHMGVAAVLTVGWHGPNMAGASLRRGRTVKSVTSLVAETWVGSGQGSSL
jgi:hypothetical protein